MPTVPISMLPASLASLPWNTGKINIGVDALTLEILPQRGSGSTFPALLNTHLVGRGGR